MDFKPNIKKVTISILVGIFIWVLFYTKSAYPNDLPFYYDNPLVAIGALIVIYVIWSLIEKDKFDKKGVKKKWNSML